MDERIIGKINGLNLPKLTNQTYNLVFTDKRIIGEFIGGTGTGFLVGGIIGSAIAKSLHERKSEKMTEVNPEEILSRNKKNFSIDYKDIAEIFLNKKNIVIMLEEKQKIVGKKSVFYFSKNKFNDVETILLKALPNKTNRNY